MVSQCDPVREKIDGGGCEFERFLRALGEISWREVSIREVLDVTPKLCYAYHEGLRCHHDTTPCRESFCKLPFDHAQSTGSGSVGASQGNPVEVEKFRAEVSRGRAELENMSSEVEGAWNANLAMRRDVKAAQQGREVPF